jgi:hypothetical protein
MLANVSLKHVTEITWFWIATAFPCVIRTSLRRSETTIESWDTSPPRVTLVAGCAPIPASRNILCLSLHSHSRSIWFPSHHCARLVCRRTKRCQPAPARVVAGSPESVIVGWQTHLEKHIPHICGYPLMREQEILATLPRAGRRRYFKMPKQFETKSVKSAHLVSVRCRSCFFWPPPRWQCDAISS